MANKGLFASARGKLVPPADTQNEAGGRAYKRPDEEALAVYSATGCLNNTFYATGEEQLEKMLEHAAGCTDSFIAHCAVYARKSAFMKDMPALLCAVLAARKSPWLQVAFPQAIDNGRMLRNFVQIVRSGVTGRKSLGSAPRRLVRQWLMCRSPEQLFRDSVGQDPSIADVIKMVHPKPEDPARAALYAYLIGKNLQSEAKLQLPPLVQDYESYKYFQNSETGEELPVPKVPFQMLTSLKLGKKEWTEIAVNAPWTMTRMNLNTFQRHGVFEDPSMVKLVAERIRSPEEVRRSRCFPYQLMMAYKASGGGATATRRYASYGSPEAVKNPVPMEIQEALQDALDVAVENVPQTEVTMYVCPDVSGSMNSPVTGFRKGSTTKVTCVEVGALITAALVSRNKKTGILPFDTAVHNVNINPRDSVMTNARKLSINGGGTDCSLPLRALNNTKSKGDLVIFISDYESWADSGRYVYSYRRRRGTSTMEEWLKFKVNNPAAKMICINLVPTSTSQTEGSDDIIQVAGFSDQVFHLIAAVAKGEAAASYWIDQIKQVGLNEPREKCETE